MLLTPAEYVIHVFKGVRATARAISRAPGSVSKWRKNGEVPSAAARRILEVARERNLDITPSDLAYGRLIKKARRA